MGTSLHSERNVESQLMVGGLQVDGFDQRLASLRKAVAVVKGTRQVQHDGRILAAVEPAERGLVHLDGGHILLLGQVQVS